MNAWIRNLAKAVVPATLRWGVRTQIANGREKGLDWLWKWNAMLFDAWVRDWRNRDHYGRVTESQARARRKSDTVFVCGSGYSLHDVTAAEWAHIAEHDVFGFSQFFYQRWVRVDFHLLRGGFYGELRWRTYAEEVEQALADHPCFKQTVFVLQEGYLAQFGNQLVGYGLMPPASDLLRFRTARDEGRTPARSLKEGLRHHGGTMADVVNCAYCLGWKHIVLVGVDLYDSRYFYLPPDQTVGWDEAAQSIGGTSHNQTRGQRYDEPHNTVRIGIVDLMAEWRHVFEADGVSLSVYNPKSVMADVLPVYVRPETRDVVTR